MHFKDIRLPKIKNALEPEEKLTTIINKGPSTGNSHYPAHWVTVSFHIGPTIQLISDLKAPVMLKSKS